MIANFVNGANVTGSEFQVASARTETAREEKLPVTADGLTRRLMLEERNARIGMDSK